MTLTQDEPVSAQEFRDDESYLDWRNNHPHGFVINIRRSHNPSDARLHDAGCSALISQIDRDVKLADQYVKVCGNTLEEVREWATEHVGEEIVPCGTCRAPHTNGPNPGRHQLCPRCLSYELLANGKCPSCDEE